MRPLLLTMQAFGPYKTCETVDFGELGANKLFLIHGETGAGKTSILDAIVFALYGDTSGGERQATQMRCTFADPRLPTEVVLEFALGPRTFRVRRRPKQEVAATRGDGHVVKQAEATLWETTGAGPGEEGQLLGTKIGDVADSIHDLLGFSSEQFRQVVVLPQGRFRELLAAKSDEREEILKQLFRTEQCAELATRLRERDRGITQERDELRMERRLRLEGAGLAEDADLASLLAEAEAAVVAGREAVAKADEEARAADRALAEAERADEALAAVGAAREALATVQAKEPEIEALREAVTRAREAERVMPLAQAADAAAKRLRKALGDKDAALAALAAAAETQARAAEALAREEEREQERLDVAAELRTLNETRERLATWREAERLRLNAAEELVKAQRELGEATASVAEANDALDLALGQAQRAIRAIDGLAPARAALQTARALAKQCGQRDQAAKGLRDASAARDRAADDLRRADDDFAREDAAYRRVEGAWRAARAALLAKDLVEGAPCPVCGSTSHPAPAHAAAEVDDEALDATRARLEQARARRDDCKQALAEAEGAVREASGTYEALCRAIAGDVTAEQANAEVDECEQACRGLEEATAAVSDPEALVAGAKDKVAEAEERLAAAQKRERDAADDLTGKRAWAEGLGTGVPEELRAERALDDAAVRAQQKAEELQAALEVARSAAKQADEEKIAAQSGLHAAEKAQADAETGHAQAQQALAAALSRHGFADLVAYAAALMPEDEIAAAEDDVGAFRGELKEAEGRLKQALEAVKDHPVAGDVQACRAQAEIAAAAAREAQGALHDAQTRLTALRHLRSALADLDQRLLDVDARYAVVGRLSLVANGLSSADGKVSFQRWVLGAYLDEVLEAASRRLAGMSRSRFRLERQREAADLRRASGLDLAVFDAWSNRSRPAVTLSGGESFLAALSLALGLAETVQEQAGGTRLETIFVDEGFGALDPDALDLAMDALVELQDTGRLVGVITHVPELRQVIDARLEVTGGPGGSHVRFHVP